MPAGEATPPLVEIEFDMLYINFIHADLFSNYQEEVGAEPTRLALGAQCKALPISVTAPPAPFLCPQAVPVAQALALAFVQQHQAIEQVREDSKKVKWAGVAVTAAAAASLFMRK